MITPSDVAIFFLSQWGCTLSWLCPVRTLPAWCSRTSIFNSQFPSEFLGASWTVSFGQEFEWFDCWCYRHHRQYCSKLRQSFTFFTGETEAMISGDLGWWPFWECQHDFCLVCFLMLHGSFHWGINKGSLYAAYFCFVQSVMHVL